MVRSFFRRSRDNVTFQSSNQQNQQNTSLKLSKNLQTNIDNIQNMLDYPADLKVRHLKLGEGNIKCAFVYIESVVDKQNVQQNVLDNIQQAQNLPKETKELFKYIDEKFFALMDVKKGTTLDDISLPLLIGYTIVYIDGIDTALMLNTAGGEMRAIEEPITETLIRGPRAGFVEDIHVNIGMIRRNVNDPNLRFKTYLTGRRSKKSLVVCYINDIVHPELLKEVDRRLNSIDIDIVPESGYVEEWIEDSFLSPFPQIFNTERPDKVVRALTHGRVVILVDGTPFVLILPMTFSEVITSPEDYYERWTIGTLLRILRYFAAFVSVFLPAIYIALTSIQPGMIPSKLAFSIAGTREGVPFPPVIEALMMVITMELLQEAGARLPQTIGQTVGIVGGLVIGEAAVRAGVVSPIMVIVIALTAVCNFAIPAFSVAITFRIIRFGFIFAAGIFGLYGIVLAYIMLNIHFVNLKSFGVPYTTPFAPFFKTDWKDLIVRFPIPSRQQRTTYLLTDDKISMDDKGENG